MNILSSTELLKITDPVEFFKRKKERFNFLMQQANRRYAENKLVVEEDGQWVMKLGDEPSFDEAFGPATQAEIEINKKMPLSKLMRDIETAQQG